MKALLAYFAFAATLAAQAPALFFDLSGDWRFQAGDRPQYSESTFDDSAWQPMRLPRSTPPPAGRWWLRRTVELATWPGPAPLAITLGSVNEVYEVYVNGIRIAAVGEPRLAKTYTARPRTFTIPSKALPTGTRRVTLALRLWTSPLLVPPEFGTVDFPDTGPYLLTDDRAAPRDAGRASMAIRERAASGILASCAIEFALGILLLLCWFFPSSRRDLVWFAGFLFSEALTHAWIFFTLAGDWPHGVTLIIGNALSLGPLLLAQFALPLIRDGSPKRALQVLAPLAFLLQLANNATMASFNFAIPLTVLGIMEIGLILLTADSAITAWRRGDRLAGLIPAGLSLLTISQLSLVLTLSWSVGKTSVKFYGIAWEFTSILTIVIAAGLTVQLIRGLGAASQRLSGEMDAARAVQQFLLPSAPADSSAALKIDAVYEPASEVGGDFYQTLHFPDGAQVILVGDVSGKGLRAAMLVSVAIGALRRETSSSPAAILAGLNQALTGHTGGGFVTCCCVRYQEGKLASAASAGHPNPYVNGQEVPIDAGLPLGISADASYQDLEFELPASGQLTLVSDGVVEAENAKRELFGFDRTREISSKSAQEIANAAKAWGQTDDITVVVVQRAVQ